MTLCVATRRDGSPCTQHAMHNTTVCKMHGGKAPQVQRRAAVRASLQEQLRDAPQRPWHEIYQEAMTINDVIMQHCRRKVEQGETLSPVEMDQLVQAAGRAALLAKGAADIGVATQLQRQQQMEAEILVTVLGRTVDALGLPQEFRVWVLGFIQQQLLTIEDDAAPVAFEPPPGRLAVVREIEAPVSDVERPVGDDQAPVARRGARSATVDPRSQFVDHQEDDAQPARTTVVRLRNPDGSITTSGRYADG